MARVCGVLNKRIIRLSANPDGFGRVADPLDEQAFLSEVPTQHTHYFWEDDDTGLYVGVWDTTSMIETAGPYPCDEFMWLLEGEVEIKNSRTGAMEKVQAGEAFIIPRGYDCQWHQNGYLRKFFVILEDPSEDGPQSPVFEGTIRPRADVPPMAMASSDALVVSGDKPVQKSTVCYEDSTGKFSAGCWQSEPFESAMSGMPYQQFVYLLEGSLSLHDENDELHHFKAGDAFFLEQGTVCRWSTAEHVSTAYAIVRNTPAKDTNDNIRGINNE